MHHDNFSFSLNQISKIEGHATLDVTVENNEVTQCHFAITDFKRFYSKAVEKKPAAAAPSLLSRICGTCSNAHIMASLKAVEAALGIEITPQSQNRRELVNAGMYIRDHALHLIVFVLPDVYQVDSILDFDETDPTQRAMLENLFKLKAAGNHLSIFAGGRSVHAPDLMVGGFSKALIDTAIPELIQELKAVRPIAIALTQLFAKVPFTFERNHHFIALRGSDHYDYLLSHTLKTQDNRLIPDQHYRQHLQHVSIPHSMASGYQFEGSDFMVGSLARLNLNADQLHPHTRSSLSSEINLFPSANMHHNNLAQAIEIVDSIDYALDLLNKHDFAYAPPVPASRNSGSGIGVTEAPRGTLFHEAHIVDKVVDRYEVIVPTGQNQINIENDLKKFIQDNLSLDTHQLEHECEKLVRSYDPCMSCASHFLKFKIVKHPT
jgi:coenzyme F420-reducing hydrogenase alpha subunit